MTKREKEQRREFVIEQIEIIRRDKSKSNPRALREIKAYNNELAWLNK